VTQACAGTLIRYLFVINSVLGSTLAWRAGTMKRSSNCANNRDGPTFRSHALVSRQVYENKGQLAEAIVSMRRPRNSIPTRLFWPRFARAYALAGKKERRARY